jgi:hypothetical protein
MARRAFFSFDYSDVSRAMVVRNSWVLKGRELAGFIDAAAFESLASQGDPVVKTWINGQLRRTTVTVVLVGSETCRSRWVKYEIRESKRLGHGLLGIDVSKIPNLQRRVSTRCGRIPIGYPFYSWSHHNGYKNMGSWIEDAAKAAGK